MVHRDARGSNDSNALTPLDGRPAHDNNGLGRASGKIPEVFFSVPFAVPVFPSPSSPYWAPLSPEPSSTGAHRPPLESRTPLSATSFALPCALLKAAASCRTARDGRVGHGDAFSSYRRRDTCEAPLSKSRGSHPRGKALSILISNSPSPCAWIAHSRWTSNSPGDRPLPNLWEEFDRDPIAH